MMTVKDYRTLSPWLTEQARGTDNGLALVTMLTAEIRRRRIVVPTLTVVERLALACRARARREAYTALSADLTPEQRLKLDALLDSRGETRQTYLGWVRQSLGAANPANILSCLERLTFLRSLEIPMTWSTRLHQNRLVQIAREGANTDVTHLRAFSPERRYATLVAGVLDAMTVSTNVDTDELHRQMLLSGLAAADESLKDEDFWPGYVEGITRLALTLLGDYPDHRKQKPGRKKEGHYSLNACRSGQWVETPEQRFRTLWAAGNVGYPKLSAPPRDVLDEFRREHGFKPDHSDFMEWYRAHFPKDYALLFR